MQHKVQLNHMYIQSATAILKGVGPPYTGYGTGIHCFEK